MNDWNKIKKKDLRRSKSLGEIPQEASENIKSPELAPSDKRITGRTRQLNLKVKEEIYWLLKEIAFKEKKLMTEILEKALMEYKKNLFSETKNIEVKPQKTIISQSISKNHTNNYPFDEQFINTCSFIDREQKNLITCEKPLFDKKKALCRSHNRLVRKKFNEFVADKSIGSTGAWEMAWEQSGDWRYFWNLAAESKKDNE